MDPSAGMDKVSGYYSFNHHKKYYVLICDPDIFAIHISGVKYCFVPEMTILDYPAHVHSSFIYSSGMKNSGN